MKNFIRNLQELMAILVVVGITAAVLFLLGMLPSHLQALPGVREYDTLEEAQRALGFEIVIPTYFPSYLSWPPARITVEISSVSQVETLFVSSEQNTEVLLVMQSTAKDGSLPPSLPWIETVLDEMPISVGDSAGSLVIGGGENGQLMNGAQWKTNNFLFTMVTTQPVQELLSLARSMHY